MDSEFNFREVERFFEQHIQWFFEDMKIYDAFANNHPTVGPIRPHLEKQYVPTNVYLDVPP